MTILSPGIKEGISDLGANYQISVQLNVSIGFFCPYVLSFLSLYTIYKSRVLKCLLSKDNFYLGEFVNVALCADIFSHAFEAF